VLGIRRRRKPGTAPRTERFAPAFHGAIDFELKSSNLGLLNVLIIPDKFKGTLSAGKAAEAIARGWRQARPNDALRLLPMSDGGDGFGEVLSQILDAKPRETEAVDAAHQPCVARWGWAPESKTALIDSAAVIGLAMLPPKRFHPFQLDTYGLGLVLKAAADSEAQRCLVGIGGSATNDGGFGLARALGWRFLDQAGNPIEQWTELTALNRLRSPEQKSLFGACTVAVDVQNPLLGPAGATRVYGPQKGLRPQDFEPAERCLDRLAKVVHEEFGFDFAQVPGGGAAGGLGFGFLAFLSARLEPGFELFASQANLESQLRSADLVITGEGAIDKSTLMGKGVGQIGQLCRRLGLPCLAFAGQLQVAGEKGDVFTERHALTDLTTLEDAETKPALWLERLANSTAQRLDRVSAEGNRG